MVSHDKKNFVGVDPACCDEFMKKIGDSVGGLKSECEFVKYERNRGVGEKCEFGMVAELSGRGGRDWRHLMDSSTNSS